MEPSTAERRQADRRRADRRAAGRRRDDSLLPDAAHGSEAEGAATGAATSTGTDSFFDAGWLAAGDAPAEDRLALHRARRLARAQESALARVYSIYGAARAVVGLGLVVVHGLGGLMGARSHETLALVSVLYAVQAVTVWLLPRFGSLQQPAAGPAQRRRQWLSTIGVDLLAFSLLYLLEAGATFNYAALLVLPVLMAGVLTPRLLALGTASGVALLLLFVAWRAPASPDGAGLMLQSGLAGLGLFMITLLAGELAGRLVREEQSARGSRELARQQAQLNRLVIQEMADGVLVIDRSARVRAANPAARALLVLQGLSPPAPFSLQASPAWAGLQQALEQALAEGVWPEAGRDVMLHFEAGHSRTLRLRVRFMRRPALGPDPDEPGQAADGIATPHGAEPFAVLLLEDLRTLQARIRQDKLAAMGRVSAGIAHEIRNPLAAIAQANALLMEDQPRPEQLRLMQMVADNVQRLKRLVDDVMEVAPGADPSPRAIDATEQVSQAVADWMRTAQWPTGGQSRLRAELPEGPLGALFDPEHLRRVLVNLLDNAQRHATAQPGAVFVRLGVQDEAWLDLSVFSDGPLITPEVERHLFEPFFSTRSRGSGLGLYICRELCERCGASIEYRPRPSAERLRNQFTVRMRRAPLHDPQAALPLHTG